LVYTNELVLVPLDGSQTSRRLIHNQSRRFTGAGNGNCYYNTPHASIVLPQLEMEKVFFR